MSRKRRKTPSRPRTGGGAPRRQPAQSVADTLAAAEVSFGSAQPTPAAAGTAITEPPAPTGALDAFVQRNAPEVVGVTYRVEPPSQPPVHAVTVRLAGERLDVDGRRGPGDSFVYEETWDGLLGGRPATLTVKVRDVTPGQWQVRTQAFAAAPGMAGQRGPRRSVPVQRASWSWRRWQVVEAPAEPVGTRLSPLVPTPAVLLGSWMALVVLGILVALVTQTLVLRTLSVRGSHALPVSLLAVAAGAVGAKAWYMVLQRQTGKRDGWCIQGFVAGFAVTAPLLMWAFGVPVGPYLDASAPALLFGMAIGRVGCFLTGCCAGRPSRSRWAVWASNRAVCTRRVPVQLLESLLALAVGVATLVAVLTAGPRHGTVLAAGLAAYTMIRQGLLLLREERRQSRRGAPMIAAVATVALLGAITAAALS